MPTPRAVIRDFAPELEACLVRNDHKQDWSTMSPVELMDLLRLEVAELEHEVRVMQEAPGSSPRVGFEALDVAALAMMIHDVARGPAASENRGRR